MSELDEQAAKRDTILFDINETVLDLASLRPLFASCFSDEQAAAVWFAQLLHSSTVCALTGVKTTFALLAANTLASLAASRKIELADKQRAEILSKFSSLETHPDVEPALQLLRESGYRTVAFTNSSSQLAASQISNAGLDQLFDEIISVEKTGSFKPDPKVYLFAAESLGRMPANLRLIACHDWDTHGALSAGLDAAYINRRGTAYSSHLQQPQLMADEMTKLAELVIQADRKTATN